MIKNLLFDFDGVIMDSNPIRTFGFREIFKEFSNEQVEELIRYHEYNGGIPRFDKIRYFYREILKRDISEENVEEYAGKFSEVMKRELVKKEYLIEETLDFIRLNRDKYRIHIVSGSEEKELQWLCGQLDIDSLFISIHGSPTLKPLNIRQLLDEYRYEKSETVMIGDSINDYDAAHENGIRFFGFNNSAMGEYSEYYILSFSNLNLDVL